jgi:hypothetical protein
MHKIYKISYSAAAGFNTWATCDVLCDARRVLCWSLCDIFWWCGRPAGRQSAPRDYFPPAHKAFFGLASRMCCQHHARMRRLSKYEIWHCAACVARNIWISFFPCALRPHRHYSIASVNNNILYDGGTQLRFCFPRCACVMLYGYWCRLKNAPGVWRRKIHNIIMGVKATPLGCALSECASRLFLPLAASKRV